MSKVFDFIKDCNVFYVLTVNDDFPAGRPFGAIMEKDGDLYIQMGNQKNVYKQLKNHPQMQIIALKEGTRSWARVSGIAEECFDISTKEEMFEKCPKLNSLYNTPSDPIFALFKIKVVSSELN